MVQWNFKHSVKEFDGVRKEIVTEPSGVDLNALESSSRWEGVEEAMGGVRMVNEYG